ncbi:MAG: paraquat-inducible protein A [Fuerstiella sp.]|nr:paraquat-inducible protein A [Fuerstiella sp.]
MEYKACHCCGQIHRLPILSKDQLATCIRCQSKIAVHSHHHKSASRTAAAAVAAFLLFWPAVLCPILKIDQLGQHSESSIISGGLELLSHGNWFVGAVVLLFSIVFPLTKIVMLLELSLLEILQRRHKALTLRVMEQAGRWSMMDVMLLAFLVMLVKLGNLVEFQFGPAVIAFILCVTMSMIASLSFDPHTIWENKA